MRTGRPLTLPPGPYADLVAAIGTLGKTAEALKVRRQTITAAAQAGRWLTGEPGVRLHTLCRAYKVQVPEGMRPSWIR